ncbi:MAG: hypothetical protein ACREKN_01775 [Longimicrobiaceae bacterium]
MDTPICFRAGRVRVEVEAAGSALGDLRSFYPAYQESRGTEPADQTVRVVPAGAGFEIITSDQTVRAKDRAAALAQTEVALTRALLSGFPGHLQLHAAGVAGGRGAVLLPAPAGSGKSTLAAALCLRGLPVLGDDVVLYHAKSSSVEPFKRLLKLERDVWPLLGLKGGMERVGTIWPAVAQLDPEVSGRGWAGPSPVAVVLMPRFEPGARLKIEPVPGGEAAVALIGQSLNFRADLPARFRQVAALADTAGGARMTYGNLDQAVEEVARLAGSGPEWT